MIPVWKGSLAKENIVRSLIFYIFWHGRRLFPELLQVMAKSCIEIYLGEHITEPEVVLRQSLRTALVSAK